MRFLCFLLALFLCMPAGAEEEEIFYSTPEPVQKVGTEAAGGVPKADGAPGVVVSAPLDGQSYEKGGHLTVTASGTNCTRMSAVLVWDGGEVSQDMDGHLLDVVLSVPQMTTDATLTVYAYSDDDAATQTVHIISPREKLFEDMFALAEKNSRDPHYKHAPAQKDTDRGVCKNFVMRLFDTFKADYRMKEYPELSLHMPLNKSKKASAPYQYGIEWREEEAKDGSPFYIAAQYKYNKDLTKAENMQACRQVLHQVQRGDFFQMCGDYYYGNGPHSLLFMSDWDEQTDKLHWTDSNMKGDRVNGDRWGYLQYDAVNTAEWFVEAISGKSTYKTRGCTIYRLREDLFIP